MVSLRAALLIRWPNLQGHFERRSCLFTYSPAQFLLELSAASDYPGSCRLHETLELGRWWDRGWPFTGAPPVYRRSERSIDSPRRTSASSSGYGTKSAKPSRGSLGSRPPRLNSLASLTRSRRGIANAKVLDLDTESQVSSLRCQAGRPGRTDHGGGGRSTPRL